MLAPGRLPRESRDEMIATCVLAFAENYAARFRSCLHLNIRDHAGVSFSWMIAKFIRRRKRMSNYPSERTSCASRRGRMHRHDD